MNNDGSLGKIISQKIGLKQTLNHLNKKFNDYIFDKWFHSGIPTNKLRFEIGEEDLYKIPNWKEIFTKLRSQGFGVIISHFGMNIQTVLNLSQMPIDAIKLDTSLTADLATSIPRRNLIDAIVKTANQSNIDIIASHIETPNELELLLAREIDQVQGFHLRKPFPL